MRKLPSDFNNLGAPFVALADFFRRFEAGGVKNVEDLRFSQN